MKKIIIILVILLASFIGFAQNAPKKVTKSDSTISVISNDQKLDIEYIERPFIGSEEINKPDKYAGMTDHEIYNDKVKEMSIKNKKK